MCNGYIKRYLKLCLNKKSKPSFRKNKTLFKSYFSFVFSTEKNNLHALKNTLDRLWKKWCKNINNRDNWNHFHENILFPRKMTFDIVKEFKVLLRINCSLFMLDYLSKVLSCRSIKILQAVFITASSIFPHLPPFWFSNLTFCHSPFSSMPRSSPVVPNVYCNCSNYYGLFFFSLGLCIFLSQVFIEGTSFSSRYDGEKLCSRIM